MGLQMTHNKKQSGGGYTNVVPHNRSDHLVELQKFLNDSQSVTPSHSLTHSCFYVRKSTANLYAWIDSVVNGLQPFSIMESSVSRKHIKYWSISLPTLAKYMRMLTCVVEDKIRSFLPQKFV